MLHRGFERIIKRLFFTSKVLWNFFQTEKLNASIINFTARNNNIQYVHNPCFHFTKLGK